MSTANRKNFAPIRPPGSLTSFGGRWLPCAFACLATLLSAPGYAVEIPNVPLQSGTAYPAPNIMFILDDSGSMDDNYMEVEGAPNVDNYQGDDDDDIEDAIDDGFDEDLSSMHNSIYYDPTTDYQPWMTAAGVRMTGGTSYAAAYADPNMVGDPYDTLNLADDDSCENVSVNTTGYENNTICGGIQTYFVLKPATEDFEPNTSDIADYYRYQLRVVPDDGVTGTRVVRSEFGPATTVTVVLKDESGLSRDRNDDPRWLYFGPFTAPPGAESLRFESSGGNDNGDADLYVKSNENPSRNDNECERESDGNDHVCVIDDDLDDEYYVGLRADDRDFSNVRLTVTAIAPDPGSVGVANAGCGSNDDYAWRKCTFATPTYLDDEGTEVQRSEAEELVNFATWFSYFRTRMKAAKAGASDAFNLLGENFRVGFDTIWNRKGLDSVSGNDPAYPIPVANDDGLFKRDSDNRRTFFDYLHKANGYNGTPLHAGLQRTGEYFESDAPWTSVSGEISCRQNFAILTTDGYWNSTSGYDDVGDVDTEDGSLIEPPADGDGSPYTYNPSNPYQDPDGAREDTLADVAMYYWNRDLRPLLANNVPHSNVDVPGEDPAFWQHMVTFGVSIGLRGELNPKTDLKALTDGDKDWPNPLGTEDEDRIDDLWHAAVNGRGEFVVATDSDEFVRGLLAALSTIDERRGSASNVTANSTSFRAETRVYQASYQSGRWSGNLEAYVATAAGVATTPEWSAAEGIPDTRNILTWNGSAGETFPTDTQEAALDVSDRLLSPATGAQNAAYIAGEQSREVKNDGNLRNRTTVLGDIANSSPIYVEDSQTLFVGANDGMLHALDAGPSGDGEELFAYVPAGIDLDDLASLSDPQYTHKYFVDGPIAISAKSQTPGKNYLVAALGRGGKGVFGLDVTDPNNFAADDVLWDFASDSDIGMVLGDPLIVTLNDASATKAVIVSNGINSTDGSAVLFVLNLATGAVIAEIDTLAAGDNGLSAPRGADLDLDGTVDFVYAGDLKGNLWKFDLSSADTDDWGMANSGSALFVARDSLDQRQPITAGVALAKHPDTGDIWVFFGTGSFMTGADLISTNVQSLYGIIDAGSTITGRTLIGDGDLVERDIIVDEVILTDFDDDGDGVTDRTVKKAVRGFEPSRETLESGKSGWYIDLDEPVTKYAERVVSGLRVLSSVLIASSIIPPEGNTCDPGGSGYINALDAFTGTSTSKPFFDIDGNGSVDDADRLTTTVNGEEVVVGAGSIDLGIGMPTRPTVIDKLLVVGGSEGSIASVTIKPQGIGARRISWREIRGG